MSSPTELSSFLNKEITLQIVGAISGTIKGTLTKKPTAFEKQFFLENTNTSISFNSESVIPNDNSTPDSGSFILLQ